MPLSTLKRPKPGPVRLPPQALKRGRGKRKAKIVGLVQALVFAMLTMAFMAVLTTPHHHEEAREVSKV